MTIVLVLCLGGLTFSTQEMPGLVVSPMGSLTGQAACNFRLEDMDGDGVLDVVLPEVVYFQREDRFPLEARAPFPASALRGRMDLWGGAAYVAAPGHVRRFRWDGERWLMVEDMPCEWPPSLERERTRNGGAAEWDGPGFMDFLHDMDGDGAPEIVLVSPAGVHSLGLVEDRYVERAVWPVLPSLALLPGEAPALWPKTSRSLTFLPRAMSCRLVIESGRIRVLRRNPLPSGEAVTHEKTWTWTPSEFGLSAPNRVEDATPPMPYYIRACRLNEDDETDYAGGVYQPTKSMTISAAVWLFRASLDGGASFFTRRGLCFPGYRNPYALLDFDGDGDKDIVCNDVPWLSSGVKEVASRLSTSRKLEHQIRVYLQVPGGFSEAPALVRIAQIQLEKPPLFQGPMFRAYRRGEVIDITGDFNGDGYKDLLVRERLGRLRVYLAEGFRFSSEPAAELPMEGNARFAVADVDGDGRGDIVFYSDSSPEGGQRDRQTWVAFSREAGL
jgi:hypothetical protein